MFFWNRPFATPTPDDPYTVLPGPKSRRRSEIPATSVPTYDVGQLLRDESSVCSQHSRVIPGPDVWRDPMRVSREQREDTRLQPVIGRQRSRSVGESRPPPSREHHQQRWNGAGLFTVYPGTARSVRAGGSNAYVGGGDEEEEQSVRLQGMPAGIDSGLGRKRSRSAGASTHPRSDQHRHQPAYRHHQGVASFNPIYSGVYVEYGVGAAEERPGRIGLGRQRSRSAGEIMCLRHGHRHPGGSGSGGVVEGQDLREYHQEQQEARSADTAMGRQRSRSVGEKIRLHMQPHVRPPQSAVPQTRPLALVDKHVVDGRDSPSSSRYPLPGPSAPPPSSADLQYHSLSQHQANSEHVQPRPQYRDPPPSQSQHLPMPRSILRMRADSSSRDHPKPPSGPKPIPPSQRSKYSPSPPAPHIASAPPTSFQKRGPSPNLPSLPHSQIPVSQSQCRGHVDEHRVAESGYEHRGGYEPGVRGHDEIGIVPPVVGMGCDGVGVRGRVHHDQPLHRYAPFDGNETQDRASAPAGEPGRSSSNIRKSTHLPNPHPHPDQEAEDDSVVLMPSDRLFEMERLSLLGAPSSSSARSSPIGSIVSQRVVVAERVPRRSSPAGHGGSVVLVKDCASGIDVVSACSDSAPALEERLMDVSFPSTIKSSNLFAPPTHPTPPTPIPTPFRTNTPSSSTSSSAPSRSSSTSTSAPDDMKQRQHIRALERELERNEVVVAEAIGETFRAREWEAAWKRRVGELEAVLRVGGGAGSGGVDGGAVSGVEGEVVNLKERLRVVAEERDEALMLVAEVRRVVQVVGGAAISR